MHTLNAVYYLCVPRDSIILILRVRQKDAAGHDRNCSSNSWPIERQIEVLAAGLQKGGGSLNKPHRKWSLTNSKLRSPQKEHPAFDNQPSRFTARRLFVFPQIQSCYPPYHSPNSSACSCVSFTSQALSDLGCEAEGCRNN
ncbi:MAG: hypothetical protein DMF12_09270 [Verrucomicrobia bacterium]|nr:MAG: hypothetical protein DMF12_09270 [Verrucomicrobiota bacterium]